MFCDFENVASVGDAAEQRLRDPGVGEDRNPFVNAEVRRENDTGLLVKRG